MNRLPVSRRDGGDDRGISQAVLELVAAIPASREEAQDSPEARIEALTARAAKSAAGIAGAAALVPGPLGLLSLVSDVVGVWCVQAQLVADIAAVYGKTPTLTTETMLYCLFRHLLSQGIRDVVVRAGERYVVRAASRGVLKRLAGIVGVQTTQRAVGKLAARYAPVVGAMGVGAYAFYDTRRVARTARELFSAQLVFDAAAGP